MKQRCDAQPTYVPLSTAVTSGAQHVTNTVQTAHVWRLHPSALSDHAREQFARRHPFPQIESKLANIFTSDYSLVVQAASKFDTSIWVAC